MLTRRELVIGAGLLLSGASALLAGREQKPEGPRQLLGALLTQAMGPWAAQTSQDAILSPDALAGSIYDEVVARRYVANDRPAVTLVAAYGLAQSYATQLHRPEICYPASGFRVLQEATSVLTIEGRPLPANILVARRGLRTDSVLYWSRVGVRYPQSLWEQRRAILSARLRGEDADGILVRISCRSDVSNPIETLREFAMTMWNHLPTKGRDLFFGVSAGRAKA